MPLSIIWRFNAPSNVTGADRRCPERARDQCAARRAVARDLGSQPDGACIAEPKEVGPVRPSGDSPGAGPLFEQRFPAEGCHPPVNAKLANLFFRRQISCTHT